jgi:phosphoglycerate dehydrogenase-like enzyme
MAKFKILIPEPFAFDTSGFPQFDIQIEPDLWSQPDKLQQASETIDALVVRNQTKVTANLLSNTRLKAIGRLGIGLDNIDLDTAKAQDIPIVYAPEANTRAIAEYCLAQCFNLLRMYPANYASTAQGGWERFNFVGGELSAQTVGLIGFGRNGRLFAEMLQALGANVIVYARRPETVPAPFTVLPFDEVLQQADIISLHIPGGSATKHLFNAATFTKMKPSSYLINAARGSIVDEAALAHALQSGHLAGAALDVREVEPPAPGLLESCPNILLTAHIAGFSTQAEDTINQGVLNDVLAILEEREPKFPAYNLN